MTMRICIRMIIRQQYLLKLSFTLKLHICIIEYTLYHDYEGYVQYDASITCMYFSANY